jgi:hypothetical protein
LDVISEEALDGLGVALSSLLPTSPDPALEPVLQVLPRRVVPTGIGGFVGPQAVPVGEILGRRVEANARIMVRARDRDDLIPVVDATTRALLAADRATLTGSGILSLTLDTVGDVAVSGQGVDRVASRELSFRILYEFLKRPEAAGGVIEETPVVLDLQELDR